MGRKCSSWRQYRSTSFRVFYDLQRGKGRRRPLRAYATLEGLSYVSSPLKKPSVSVGATASHPVTFRRTPIPKEEYVGIPANNTCQGHHMKNLGLDMPFLRFTKSV